MGEATANFYFNDAAFAKIPAFGHVETSESSRMRFAVNIGVSLQDPINGSRPKNPPISNFEYPDSTREKQGRRSCVWPSASCR